jgi:glucose-1-phosphate adenylyltransferase
MAPWRPKRDVIAIILAGGQGERLSILSAHRAKPAVPFAGKYRIIDFALSNCVNSGLYDVIVLTQYRPVSLHDHIGTGKPWDLDRQNAIGVRMISPYLGRRGADWYRGTADAVYQNIQELRELRPAHTVVLGGDHIYAMDYNPMIAQHLRSKADVTIGLQEVPVADAHRFGIATADRRGQILDWQEKPRNPESNLASLGFYVFRTEKLIERLIEDVELAGSKRDFGGDVVPRMIADGDRVFGHRFGGYWRDVGTIQSYWEAHMELLDEPPLLDLSDRGWPIHTKTEGRPPGVIGSRAHVSQSMISHGCRVFGHVERSVLSPGVLIEEGAVVRDSIVLFDSAIGANAIVDRAVIDKEAVVSAEAQVGYGDDSTPNQTEPGRLNTGITLIGKRALVPYGVRIGRNCRIDPGVDPEDFLLADLPSGTTVPHRIPEH